jgi:hypothetical protein
MNACRFGFPRSAAVASICIEVRNTTAGSQQISVAIEVAGRANQPGTSDTTIS